MSSKRLAEVSILLCVGFVVACGSNRNGKVRGTPGAGNQTGTAMGQKVSQKFDNSIREVLAGNPNSTKPKPETPFLSLARDFKQAYSTALGTDKKQADANLSLDRIFRGAVIDYPQMQGENIFLRVKTADSKIILEGSVNTKSGTGQLKAVQAADDASLVDEAQLLNEAGLSNEEQNEAEQQTAALQKKPMVRSSVAGKPAAQPVSAKDRYMAQVRCFDPACMQMLIKYIDRTRGFYPVIVKSIVLYKQTQFAAINLLPSVAEKIKSRAADKAKINEPGENGTKWSMELTEAQFTVHAQIVVELATTKVSGEMIVLNGQGERTGIEQHDGDLDLSNSSLVEQLIGVSPKK